MKKDTARQPIERRRTAYRFLPAIGVFLVSVLALVSVSIELDLRYEENLRNHFQFETDRISAKIDWSLNDYAQLLRSGAGLFAATDTVNRTDWKRFIEKLDLDQTYLGIQGVGFSAYIPPERLDAHVREVRAQGFPDYVVKPEGKRDQYSSIVYLEPFTGRNLRAFGYDMFSEPVRRDAMERARDTGAVALSGKVKLVQETTTGVQAGFLAYHPVYAKNTFPQTIAQRRTALVGWVYSPYRMNDLVGAMLKNDLRNIRLEIFDGEDMKAESLLYDSEAATIHQIETIGDSRFVEIKPMNFGGRTWTLRYTALPGFSAATRYEAPWVEFTAIGLIAILLFAITWVLINMRQRAERMASTLTASLQESEERFRATFEQAAVGIAHVSPAGRFLRLNNRFCEIAGRSREEMERLSFQEITHPEDLAVDLDLVRKMQDHVIETCAIEKRYIRKDGSVVWIHLTVSGVFVGDELRYSIAVAEDINERRAIEADRRRLVVAVEQSPAAVVIVDTHGRIEYVNPAVCRTTGYTQEELIGQNPRVLKSGETSAEEYRVLWETITSGQAWTGIFHNRRKDGSLFWEQAHISPVLEPNGKILHYLAIKEDITERKAAEEALKEARKAAEEANRSKSQFLAAMSHEIRTPMNGVIGMTHLLLGTPLSQEQREFAETIASSAETLLSIINDILDFSKIEAGRMELEKIPLEPRDVVRETCILLSTQAASRGLAIDVSVADDVPEWVMGDPVRLRQVLTNLIGNAVKFTERGKVTVEVAADEIGGDAVRLRFSVRDTGIGMTPAVMANLFSPFCQGDVSTTRRFGGTGLGLSISKRIVDSMGGRIDAESIPGVGSLFTFSVPFERARAGRVVRSEELPPSPPVRAHVLVVDDNEINRKVAAQMLSKLGLTSIVVPGGIEAIEALQSDAFDLVLMDCEMPDMDGYEVTRRIRSGAAGEGLRAVPVVAMTANAMAGDRERCLAAGMDDYLPKPIVLADLSAVIAKRLTPSPGSK